MDKAVLYSHEVGRVMSHEPGKVLPGNRKVWPRFSLGVRTANFIFPAGQPGVDNEGNVLAVGDMRTQVGYAFDNVRRIIESGGGRFDDVFKVRVFINDAADYEAMVDGVEEYLGRYFADGEPPVFSCTVAKTSSGLTIVEPEAWAATEHRSIRSDALFPGFAPGVPSPRHVHAVRVGNLVFTSGHVGMDAGGTLVGDDAGAQTEQALANVVASVEAAGLRAADIVKLNTFVADVSDAAAVREARTRFLQLTFADGEAPASATLAAAPPLPGVRVEIEAVAAAGRREFVHTAGAYDALPGGEPYTQAVKVMLESEAGSFLRRFTWPSHPTNVDRDAIGGHLERSHDLGHLVFLSAQAPFGRDGELVGAGDMAAQARQVFENVRAVCAAAGGRFSDVVQADYYFAERDLYEAFNEVRVRFCEEHYPDKDWFAGSAPIAASTLDGVLLEFEAIAAMA